MRICIFEDRHARGLEPLTLTRPVADLLCGLSTLGDKHVRHFAATSVGHLCRPAVADLVRGRDVLASVNDPTWLRGAPTVLVNARWVTPGRPAVSPRDRRRGSANLYADGPHIAISGDQIAYAVLDTRL